MPFQRKQTKQIVRIGGKRVNVTKEFREQNRLRRSFEKKLRNQMNRYFVKQHKQIAELYEIQQPYNRIFTQTQELATILQTHYRQVIDSFGERQLRNLEKQDARFEQIYQDYVNSVGAERVVGIQRSTQKRIQRIITNNQDEGVVVIAKKIREDGDSGYSKYRSSTIARTETHNASSFANHRVALSQNIPDMMKRWTATNDSRTRSTHVQASGQTVPIDEDFTVGGRSMGYTGDPRGGASNVINCRCVIVYVTPEDVVTDDTTITPKPRQARDIPKPIEFSITDVVLVSRGVKPEDYNEKLLSGTNDVQKKAMNNLPKPRKIVGSNKGFQQPSSHTIFSHLDRSTLVHEYGHHIDQQIAYLEKLGKEDAIQLSKSSFNGQFIAFTDNNLELRQAFEKDKEKLKFGKLTTVPKKDREEYKRIRERNLQGFRDELFNIKKDTTREVTFADGTKRTISTSAKKEFRYKNSDALSDIVDSMVKGDFRRNYNAYGHGKSYWKRRDTDLSETFANFFASYSDENGRAFMQKYIPNTFRIMEKKLIEISNLPN